MSKRTRVATEQAREFYEKVVKPRWREREKSMYIHAAYCRLKLIAESTK